MFSTDVIYNEQARTGTPENSYIGASQLEGQGMKNKRHVLNV